MGYNQQKRPEMIELRSLADAARVMYRGSRGNEIIPGTENRGLYNPQKRPEMLEITSLADAARVVYRGSRGNEIFPGTKNPGL